jgi:hypothetical protein
VPNSHQAYEIITSLIFVNKLEESVDLLHSNGRYQANDIEKLQKAIQEEFSPIVIEG